MPHAEAVDDKIVVTTSWNDKELVKSIPGSRWDPDDRVWTLPLTWAACVQLRGVFEQNLTIGSGLTQWSWREFKERVDPALKIRDITELDNGDPDLYSFQRAGVQFLEISESALLGDEMGTGKTIQLLTTISMTNSLPTLVVCPNSVKSNWAKEAKKWLPEATPYVLTGSMVQRTKLIQTAATDPTALVIVNFEALPKLSRLAGFGSIRLARCASCDPKYGDKTLTAVRCEVHPRALNQIPFKSVVVDEAHRIKDPKAKQTRAVWAVSKAESVIRRWALTGTPLANDPSDLWSLMHFVEPDEYPTKSKFVDRYALQAWNSFGGLDVVGLNPQTRQEFYKIFDPRFRRMPKELVLTQLPAKIRSTRFVEMTPKQAKAYNDLSKKLVTKLADGTVLVAKNNLTAQTRLLQLSSSYCKVELGETPDDPSTWTVELTEPSPKIDELMVILDELGDRQCVVAAESRRLIELAAARLKKAGIEHTLITGSIHEHDRETNLADFQAGKVRVLLFTVKAGGTGLTMTAADTIIFLQRSWSMIDNKQAEDRVHRIGSERHESIHVIDIVTSDTVEEAQIHRLNEKMERLEEITRDKVRLKKAQRDISDLELVEEQILAGNLGHAA